MLMIWEAETLRIAVVRGWSCVCGTDIVSWTERVIGHKSMVLDPKNVKKFVISWALKTEVKPNITYQ